MQIYKRKTPDFNEVDCNNQMIIRRLSECVCIEFTQPSMEQICIDKDIHRHQNWKSKPQTISNYLVASLIMGLTVHKLSFFLHYLLCFCKNPMNELWQVMLTSFCNWAICI